MPRLSAEHKDLITVAIRDKAYECACGLLRSEGWRLFTMDKLAARMGVSKGTLYNYFRDKEAVVIFIAEERAKYILAETLRLEQQCADVCEFLLQMVSSVLERFYEFRFVDFALSEILQKDGNALKDQIEALRDILTRIMERGMDEGVLRPGDPNLVAAIFHAQLMGIGMGSGFDSRLALDSAEFRALVGENMLRGLLREEK